MIVILMLMIFVMFMFVGVSSNFLYNTSANKPVQDRLDFNYSNTVTANSLNLDLVEADFSRDGRLIQNPERKIHVAIISEDINDITTKLLIEWCVYNKFMYRNYDMLKDLKEMEEYDVIIFGDYPIGSDDTEILSEYAALNTTMIFTKLPPYQTILSDRALADFFGIQRAVKENIVADGIKIFSDFMISKERIYYQGDYYGYEDDTFINVPYYQLRPGYEVYSVGLLDDQEELGIEHRHLPPLLWRTYTGQSFVFVINSEVFRGMSMLGVLTAFMAQRDKHYIYPIVNAQTISLVNYPYLSDENYDTMATIYSRSAEALSRDILWPNIIQVLKNYGDSYSFFASPQLDYKDAIGSKGDYFEFYLREINKLSGSLGLSLGQVSDSSLSNILEQNDLYFTRTKPQYNFTALFAAEFNNEEIVRVLSHKLLRNISLIMSDYKEGDSLISFVDDDVLSVKFHLNGSRHETLDDIQMITILNALGLANMKMDIGPVIYPKDSFDQWNNLSLIWSKQKTYYKDFTRLDMVNVYEMEKRIRRFLALDFIYEYDNSTIDIDIDCFDEEAYFILITHNSIIDYIENGEAVAIRDKAYLIKATDSNVRIHILEDHVLGKPSNNRLLPIN